MIRIKLQSPQVACFALSLLLVACSHPAKTSAQSASDAGTAASAPQNRYADDVGRYLAGMPANPGSPFADLQTQPAWIEHRRESDRAWKRIEEGPLPAMRAFQQRELSASPLATAPVFYPFSGPDALMITIFFPQSPRYVMIGLEPAGTLPDVKQLGRKDTARYLSGIRTTLASELGSSFFITRQMDRQFRGQVTDGLFLPILYLLVRTNHTVLGYRYVRLNEGGQIVEREAGYKAPGRIGNKGIEIDFRSASDGSVHQLFYFSVNLSDERLRENKPFLTYVSSVKGSATFLKATSYMTHRPEFSIIRDRVLDQSIAVLQDDSGIPYHFFATAWHVQLYGSYVKPYGSFRYLQQTDLRTAYLSTGPKPLEFRIGYGYSRVPSNLLLARR